MMKLYDKLTPKEQEVYNKLVNNIEGKKISELAKELEISLGTLHTHMLHIFSKFGINSQVELIIKHYKEKEWKQ